MVGSIDPRCETLRGTHWPAKVAGVFGTRVAENHLRGKPSWPAVTSRINRPDIWMQAIRSDLEKLLRHGGRPHMGPGSALAVLACPGRRKLFSRRDFARVMQILCLTLETEGAGNAGCALHPRSRVPIVLRKAHTSIQGSGGSPTSPAQWLYGLYRALPGGAGLLSPSSLRSLLLKNLTPASRRQDHTTSPYALAFSSGAINRA